MNAPVLSIGIIFRNDIRCIERCLKALQPLRDAIPCELVMADTGSEDGSREIAEKYADIVFDFPWINDFAAARNAVLERCTGQWVLSVDTDEYLDEDISQLVDFLQKTPPPAHLCRVNIRNYDDYSMDGAYADFYTIRMVHMSFRPRFTGVVHESWTGVERAGAPLTLSKTMFHHDGYVNMNNNTEKLKRNMDLLRKKLEQGPKNLITWMQIVDSGHKEPDYQDLLRKAAALVRKKPEGWDVFGPAIIRQAAMSASNLKMPEYEEWAKLAETWFPNSYFTRIDVASRRVLDSYNGKQYAECARLGEALIAAYDDYFAGRGDMDCQMCSTLRLGSPFYLYTIQIMVANAYIETGEYEKSAALLGKLDCSDFGLNHTENLVKTLCRLYSYSQLNIDSLMETAWEGISVPNPNEERARERQRAFMQYASAAFTPSYRKGEEEKNHRHASECLAVLAEKCGVGTASAVLASENPAEIERLLRTVENWRELPYHAVIHAVEAGVDFPLPDKPMAMEDMQELAVRISREPEKLRILLEKCAENDFSANWQTLLWACLLASTAVQCVRWQDGEGGMGLARLYVKIERAYTSAYYSQEVLREENLLVLPEIHRFGWYCVRAFEALEAGDAVGYTHFLREGLDACKTMKAMVEFLLDHTPALQTVPQADPELLELAEKVRAMLAAFSPDDPAVAALKASPVYQRVAYFVEGVQAPVMGGLAQ